MNHVVRPITYDIVTKLWGLCNLLRDDGVTYHEYVTELTYLLFLKMMKETGQEDLLVVFKAPKRGAAVEQHSGIVWSDLVNAPIADRLNLYERLLQDYSRHGRGTVQEIYAGARTLITRPLTLSKLVEEIDKLEWYSVHREDLGDLYEGLLERNANEKKSGAGQYFTPRVLIDSIVNVMKPNLSDVVQDPACGTGGFLVAANHYLREHNDLENLSVEAREKYRCSTFIGMELVQDTYRLALMNMLLHGIEGGIKFGDTLGAEGTELIPSSLILSNPPFGTKKGGGLPTRSDLPFVTTNKQFCFLQHIYLGLKPGGRAAVILPDNVLFDSNIGTEIRRDLMEKCNLHTILRLPAGIFYAQGVKTNVLFFARGHEDVGNTKEVWVYDMRANMPQFGKRTPFTRDYFRTPEDAGTDVPRDKFEDVFGDDPWGTPEGLAKRKESGEGGRWRRYTRAEIADRGERLDMSWLKDDNDVGAREQRNDPSMAARLALKALQDATNDLRLLIEELGEDPDLSADDLMVDENDAMEGAAGE